ncbi:FAS-associated factor 1-like [Drosophila montana]|uniref:FAS-associated factor 1-like n=1 Tax=Drosophila montana TaxID=40370 RepID=UPI00313EA354
MEHDLKQQEEQELPNLDRLTLNEADAKDDDSRIYKIKISMQPDGRSISLTLPENTTLLELKTDIYYITDIPVRHQVWSGWPLDVAVDNATNLAQSGIGRRHSFVVQSNLAADQPHNNSQSSSDFEADDKYEYIDSSSDESQSDSESDLRGYQLFCFDSKPAPTHLIADGTICEATGSKQFVDNYKQRFGAPHPEFHVGSLESALQLAKASNLENEVNTIYARSAVPKLMFLLFCLSVQRKLLAIYLHHGASILTNIFCHRLLQDESILELLKQNFVLYGWDLTCKSNEQLFILELGKHCDQSAVDLAASTKLDQLPAIMIVSMNSFIIPGNIGLDELQLRLLEAIELKDFLI